MKTLPIRTYTFYRDGFRAMVVGRTLWKIIFIKLIIMFGVLKIFFFPNFLATNFNNDTDRAKHVMDNLTNTKRPASLNQNTKNFQPDYQ